MDATTLDDLTSQQLSQRFNLLAIDAKEYAIFLLEEDGRILCWNPGAERLFGYQGEIVGRNFSCLFTPEDQRDERPEQELRAASADGRVDGARWQVRKDGSRFWCQCILTSLYDERTQAHSFARVMHDLTDSQAQDDQRKRADDLAEANRNKEDFLALLSHELRNPLAPILNSLEILQQLKTDDPIVEQTGGIIKRQVMQMVRLVDDLLDISRIAKGKLRLTTEKVELRLVANRAAETARPLMDCRKHDFSVLLPTQPIWVEADPARMEQIVVNLLNNAAKYADPGGLIRMSLQQEGADAVIRVRDNGVGIAPTMIPKIFDLFNQVDDSLSRSNGGLGIGLALVSTLLKLQGGRVIAQSGGVGHGSEFTIMLPVLPETSPPESKMEIRQIKRAEQPLRILVVEDNIDSGDSLSLLLRLHGHEVQVARTGSSGLEMATAFLPDVVLLDIGLPCMDGYQVAQRLRAMPELKSTKICALTGFTPTDADRQRQQQTGFDHHFVKPVRLETLLDLLKTVANQPT